MVTLGRKGPSLTLVIGGSALVPLLSLGRRDLSVRFKGDDIICEVEDRAGVTMSGIAGKPISPWRNLFSRNSAI